MAYRIDLTPNASYTETVSVSQDDVGREIAVDLYLDGTAYTPTTGTTITMQGTKPSGLGYTITGTASGSTVTFLTTLEMTQEAGRFASEIVLTNGSTVIGTANFALYVEKNPHPENTIDGTGETMQNLTVRMDALEDDMAALESATDVPAGYVPTADGQDGWQWKETGVDDIKAALASTKNPSGDLNIIYSGVRPDNLYDSSTAIEGYYINPSGVQTQGGGWWCTPFIEIGEYSQVQFYNIGLSAWYDENQAFVSSFTGGNNLITVPASAKYVRCSILTANVPSAVISYNIGRYASIEDRQVSHWVNSKKAYQKGYIRFTVPVNQTVASYDNTDEVNHEGTPSYIDVDCVLTLPYEYKPIGNPCKLIMMCHGAGKGVSGTDNWTENSGYNALVDIFMTRGYAVFDCNGFKNDALGWSFWGNQRGLEAWRKAYLYVTDNYNVEKTFSIYAFSMGGLTAMNLALQGFPNINAIALGSPVLNLEKVFDSTDGTANVLKTLYGLGDTWDDSKVIGNNPWKRIVNIDGTAMLPYKLPPIKIWYGSAETGNTNNPAVEKELARQFVNAITACGNYAYYREVEGRGHEICYGGSSVVNAEILTFIQRYEMMRKLYYN